MKSSFQFLLSFAVLWASTGAFSPLNQKNTRSKSRLFLADQAADKSSSSKQAQYGKDLELPPTYVRCGKCQVYFSLTEDELGRGKGRRLECSVCDHSWFQSKDRLMQVREGLELVAKPAYELASIQLNIKENKNPSFQGDFKLYVGNIAFECTEENVYEAFSKVGIVGDIALVRDDVGKNRGFGFVTMRTKEDGEKAMEELNGTELMGRSITVRESNN